MKVSTVAAPDPAGRVSYVTENSGGTTRPVPDPTVLTTQQLQREIAALKEIIFTRLDGMDAALVTFSENITRVPTDTDKQIQQLKELHQEKLASVDQCIKGNKEALGLVKSIIDTRLDGMDKSFGQLMDGMTKFPTRIDEKISTALQTAKEAFSAYNQSSALAISKAETSTAKQIDQQRELIQSVTKASDEKINDVKERLTRIESKTEGGIAAKTSSQSAGHYIASIIGTMIGIAGLALAIITLMMRK